MANEGFTREEVNQFLSGFRHYMEEIIPIYSRYNDIILPNEELPVIQFFSTEAKIHFLKIRDKGYLAWDLRWIQHVQGFLKCYYFFQHRRSDFTTLEKFGQSSRYRLERLTSQFLLDKLNHRNSQFLKLKEEDRLLRISTFFFEKCQQILKEADPNGLTFPQEKYDDLHWAAAAIESLTVDHEIIHYAELGAKDVIDFEKLELEKFIKFLRGAGEHMIFNEFGYFDWKYLEQVEIGATLKKALNVLESGNKQIQQEIYADLIAVRGSIRWLIKKNNLFNCPIEQQAPAYAQLYEGIMLWQISLIYFDGLNYEISSVFEMENKQRSFSNTDIGARKFIVNTYCWFFLMSYSDINLANPTSSKNYKIMEAEMRKVEQNIQGFMTVFSRVGMDIHRYLDYLKLIHGPFYDKKQLTKKIIEANNFPTPQKASNKHHHS
ncbi:MAG: hypothetical protein ABJH72_21720 [Reichenbachiella sp.]|uniref:hypothetical protein n=1 Tax=Reichenbachiella sp. TaxID=2184521 RepID=UPI00326718A5